MRIRMYLRGLGIGIIVTALIMGLSANRKQTLSDEEIKSKAAALGMVEQDSVLKPIVSEEGTKEPKKEETKEPEAEPQKEEVKEPAEEPKKEEAEKPAEEPKKEEAEKPAEEPKKEEAEKPAEEPKKEETEKPAEEPKKEETKEPEAEPQKAESTAETNNGVKTTGKFTIEIAGGSGSETVCKLLQKGGVIASASDFDKYLCDHGYDHKIRTGKHTIPAGADYETIAKIITGN